MGPEHPNTLTSMSGLAESYRGLGRIKEAIQLHEKAFEIRRRVLGPEHPDTLSSMSNLSSSYDDLGRKSEGELVENESVSVLT